MLEMWFGGVVKQRGAWAVGVEMEMAQICAAFSTCRPGKSNRVLVGAPYLGRSM